MQLKIVFRNAWYLVHPGFVKHNPRSATLRASPWRRLTGLSVAWSNTSVNDTHWHRLDALVAALAEDSILIQKRIDQHAHAQQQSFVSVLAQTPESLRGLLLSLAPSSQRVISHSVSCSVRMTKQHGISGSILVSPLNLGFALLHHHSAQEESSVSVDVIAVPVPAADPLRAASRRERTS